MLSAGLGEIGKRTEELKALTDQRAQTADSEGMGKIDEKANRVVQEVQAFAAAIKKTLDELNRENKDFTAKFHDAENSSSLQMRIKLFALHIILYKEALGEFSRAHTKFLDDAKSGQKRRLQQVSAAQPESRLDAKEIDDLVESGRAAEVIQQAIISDDLRSCIAEIEQRHDKILALERDIRSLYEVFKDVAKLVDVQQNSIDIIEDHIQKAKGYTEKAEQALTSAEKHQKCSRTVSPPPNPPLTARPTFCLTAD